MKNKFLFALLMMVAIFLGACSDTDDSTTVSKKDKASIPKYEIVKKDDDASIGDVIRMDYWVVPEKKELSNKEIEGISKKVIETAKKDKKFNAMMVYFIKDEDQVGKGYDIAKAEYSPEGDWSKAMDVKAGKYKNYDLIIEKSNH